MAENKENKVAKENLMSLDQMPEKKGEYDVNNGSDENHSSHHHHRKHHSQKKRKVMKTIGWIASIIQLLLSLFLMFFLYLSAFLPNKYLVGILVGLIVLFILPRFLMKHYHHKGRFYTGLALAIVLSILFGVIGYYYQEIVNTAKGITGATSETTVYGVYVLKEDSAKELKDAKEYTFGILKSLDRTNTDKAIDKVNKQISSSVKTEEFEDMLTQADALSNKEVGAILLNEAYYELLKTGQMMIDGIPVLSPTCLIPFKAKAWLDLKERKLNGEQVDSKNIKKHKNDVFRLAQLITANTRQVLSPEIAEDMKKFLSEIADETVDLKSLGIRGTDKKKMTEMLYQCYGLKDNT